MAPARTTKYTRTLATALFLSVAVPPATIVVTATTAETAQAFDLKKAGRKIRKDFGKAGKNLGKVRKQVTRDLQKNGAGRKLVTGIGVGILAGIATDSPAAGILAGVAVAAAPDLFKKQLYDAHGRDMDWAGSVHSGKRRIVTPPGRQISSERRAEVNAAVKEDVKDVQRALAQLGLYTKAIDGDFGPGSRAGVKEFQRGLGNAETGILTAEERHRLFIQAQQDGYVRQASLGTKPKATVNDEPSTKPVAVNAIKEYRLAKSRFDILSQDALRVGAITAVTAAALNPDGSVTLEVTDASGVNKTTVSGPIGNIYAEPHALADEWARIYYRDDSTGEAVILNTRDDFATVDDAKMWIDEVNEQVTLLRKLTGEAPLEPDTRMASTEPEVVAPQASGSSSVAADDDGAIRLAETDAAAVKDPEETVKSSSDAVADDSDVVLASFDEPAETCREMIYVSFEFPEDRDTINHYNIEPPEGAIWFDNGGSTGTFLGSCVHGEYQYSYVHVEKDSEGAQWTQNKREGSFMLASNSEQCSINLNTPTGSAELECF